MNFMKTVAYCKVSMWQLPGMTEKNHGKPCPHYHEIQHTSSHILSDDLPILFCTQEIIRVFDLSQSSMFHVSIKTSSTHMHVHMHTHIIKCDIQLQKQASITKN